MKLKMLLAVMLVAGIATVSYAKSHFITPGARAGGFGTAFSAVADDLTAIYYNPAGLAYQKDTQVMASLFYIDYPATASDKSPANYMSDKYSTNAAVPFVGFSTKFFYDSVIAAGVYVLGGGGGKLENLPPFIQKVEGQQSYMVYNISLAKQITDKFSIGLGFDAIQFQDKLVAKSDLMGINIDYNRSAFGFQGNIGLMYKPIEKLSTAFVLRSGSYVDVPNEPASSNPSFAEKVCYPLTWEVGFAYDLFEDFTFAASVSQNKTSWTSEKYHDIFQYRVGTEYRATEKLALHLGFFSDPNLIKDEYKDTTYGLTNLDMYNMKYTTIGAEYKFTESLKAGLSFTHSFTNPVTHNGITYKYEVNLGRFDISYKFL
ncbi:OmpP1/FadL family transporter [Candidatus Ruminimicrobiellum ovillum]|uniref:OmpP1/FadL family transporter n=1 Tax=Candidatus Ruminimicrobiellum ovillum TaxID=1947927 RepID=UPI003559C0C9